MASTNGTLKAELIESRRQEKLLESKLRITQLTRQQKVLTESAALGYAWLDTYAARIDRYRDGGDWYIPLGGMPYDRRSGKNFPFYSSEQELAFFRSQSRLIGSKNSYAIGILEALISYIIGDGMTYRATDKGANKPGQSKRNAKPSANAMRAQDIIDEFMEREAWDEWESELLQRSREDGEFLLRPFATGDGFTTIRTAEPEQLTQSPGWSFEEGSFGVRTPLNDAARALEYHLRYQMDAGKDSEGEYLEPHEIIHFKINAKRAIKRGLPDFIFDTYDALDNARKLRTNLGEGAAIQAAIVGVRQHENATRAAIQGFADEQPEFQRTNPLSGRTTSHVRVEPGTWADIPKGMNYVDGPGATNAAAHIEVLAAGLRSAGVRWNAPEWLITGNDSQSSEASATVVGSPWARWVKRQQRRIRRPFLAVMRAVMVNAVEGGRLPREALESVMIQAEPSNVENTNELEEAQANSIRVTGGWKSRQTIMQEEGLDVEQEETNIDEWEERHGIQGGLGLPGDDGTDDGMGGAVPKPAGPGGATPRVDPFRQRMQESKDASGHEHKGKGEGGGQFTGDGGGGSGSGDKSNPDEGANASDARYAHEAMGETRGGARAKQLAAEAAINGELSKSKETGLWRYKGLTGRTPNEVLKAGKATKTAEEKYLALKGDVDKLRSSFPDHQISDALKDRLEQLRLMRDRVKAVASHVQESRDASGHEHAADGRFGKTAGAHADTHHDADAKLPAAKKTLVKKAGEYITKKYADLERDFGRKGAIAIMSASVILMVVSVLGSSLAPIALAKAYKAVKAKYAGAGPVKEDVGDDELLVAVRDLIAETCKAVGEDVPELSDEEILKAIEKAGE